MVATAYGRLSLGQSGSNAGGAGYHQQHYKQVRGGEQFAGCNIIARFYG